VRRRQLGVIVVMVVVTCSGLRGPCAAGCVLETDLLLFARGVVLALETAGRVCVRKRWGVLLLYAQIEQLRRPLVVYRRLHKKISIPAAAGSLSLDASSGLLATRRRLGPGAPVRFFRPALSSCGVSCMLL